MGDILTSDTLAAATFDITVFGGFALQCRGTPVEFSNQKGKALLGYLALTPNGTASREQLVGLFWSETEEEKARASLRQVLRTLRVIFENVGFQGFHAGRSEIVLEPSAVTIDFLVVQNALHESRIHPALLQTDRVTDTVLSGLEDVDPSFRNWLIVQRESLFQKLVRGLEVTLDDPSMVEDGTSRTAAEALIRLDPTHESACRHLIRCHAEKGDTSSALNIYNRLWTLLDIDYDMEPSETTQQLIAEVKSGTYESARDVSLSSGSQQNNRHNLEEQKLILVLAPFDLQAVSDDKTYIGVGFRYELISRLVRFREWSLIDAEAVGIDVYSQSDIKPDYHIASRLFLYGNDLQINLTLQAAGSGIVLWR